jgi:hypothetical protein
MLAIFHLLATFVANLFKPRRRLEVENLFLRHQLNIALRRTPHRLRLRGSDRGVVGMDDLVLAKPARFVPRCSAWHDPAVASSRVSGLLALEISRSAREAPS